jgi:hypothetical protein
VFLRSIEVSLGGRGGDVIESFPADVFRDSHENGLVSFLPDDAGIWAFDDAGARGGGDHGTDGSAPESPIRVDVKGALGGNGGFFSGSKEANSR